MGNDQYELITHKTNDSWPAALTGSSQKQPTQQKVNILWKSKEVAHSLPIKDRGDWFTGTVRIDSPFKGSDPARISGAIVTFEPGARTACTRIRWGRTLIVTAGFGRGATRRRRG